MVEPNNKNESKSPVKMTGEEGLAFQQAVPASFPREYGGTGRGGRPDFLASSCLLAVISHLRFILPPIANC
jgi:hypothetical protein